MLKEAGSIFSLEGLRMGAVALILGVSSVAMADSGSTSKADLSGFISPHIALTSPPDSKRMRFQGGIVGSRILWRDTRVDKIAEVFKVSGL